MYCEQHKITILTDGTTSMNTIKSIYASRVLLLLACFYRSCECFHLSISLASATRYHHGLPLYATRSSSSSTDSIPYYAKAIVDYSGANEYIQSHYNQSKYFPADQSNENIYNGRSLLSQYKTVYSSNEVEMLHDHGLTLIPSPTNHSNWNDLQEIAQNHLPDLERVVSNLFPNSMMHCFWNPMVRGNEYTISRDENKSTSTPTANIASLVHIDTDVGAYESLDDFLSLIENNQICNHENSQKSMPSFDKAAFMNAIGHENKRFAIVNFWRNTSDDPVECHPLAILSTRYDTSHTAIPAMSFPDAMPDMDKSYWYSFPQVTKDEVIVFYQYDRLMTQQSDLWHGAISINKGSTVGSSMLTRRESFDMRMLIVLDEQVPPELDRFHPSRKRPILSLEESGCFCDEQGEKRM
jgi:hypothetical protein